MLSTSTSLALFFFVGYSIISWGGVISLSSLNSIPQPTLLSSGSFSEANFSEAAPVEPGAPLIGLSSRVRACSKELLSSTPMSKEVFRGCSTTPVLS
jgi:hypothetical protein